MKKKQATIARQFKLPRIFRKAAQQLGRLHIFVVATQFQSLTYEWTTQFMSA